MSVSVPTCLSVSARERKSVREKKERERERKCVMEERIECVGGWVGGCGCVRARARACRCVWEREKRHAPSDFHAIEKRQRRRVVLYIKARVYNRIINVYPFYTSACE